MTDEITTTGLSTDAIPAADPPDEQDQEIEAAAAEQPTTTPVEGAPI